MSGAGVDGGAGAGFGWAFDVRIQGMPALVGHTRRGREVPLLCDQVSAPVATRTSRDLEGYHRKGKCSSAQPRFNPTEDQNRGYRILLNKVEMKIYPQHIFVHSQSNDEGKRRHDVPLIGLHQWKIYQVD